jgi:two-component system sensor kinase FixL
MSSDAELRLKSVIDTAIDGIITIDTRGIVESLNPAAAYLFGYSPNEVIGNNISMLMPSPDRENHDEYLDRYHRTLEPRIIGIGREVQGRKKDGSVFPMRLAVSEVNLADRKLFTGIIHDMSDVKEAQSRYLRLAQELEAKVVERTEELAHVVNKLLSTNKRLEHEVQERKAAEDALRETEKEIRKALEAERELSELKSRFVSMASHEFRTPLSTILSSASLIGRYTEEAQQAQRVKHIERIKSAVRNLTGILNDFLSLSKLEEGKIQNQPVEFVLDELFEEVVEDMQGLLKPEQVILYDKDQHDLSLYLDKRLLKNVLFNLLSNAIKYSDPGKRIWCTQRENGELISIEVRDEGIGIPEADQQHLFSRFFRAANSVNIQGTGLGLNIVRRYLELLGGSISFHSVQGEGTSFTVLIPKTQPNS